MAIVNEIKCARCDRKYSGVRSRCPYCGERRGGYGKHTDNSKKDKIKMLISIAILSVFTIAAGVLLFSSDAATDSPEIPDTVDIGSPEGDIVSEQGHTSPQEETPEETPEPEPTPEPEVASATIRYETNRREDFQIRVGETVEINVIWSPDSVTDPVIRWTSSDEEKFQVVPQGLDQIKVNVTGVGVGTATLSVFVDDIEQKCTVYVVR